MKRLGTLSVFAVLVILMSARAFAGTPETLRQAAPEPAKTAFLQSLQAGPEVPAQPDFLNGQPAPSPRSCLGDCYAGWQLCLSHCTDTPCRTNCWDHVYQPCQCSCGHCA